MSRIWTALASSRLTVAILIVLALLLLLNVALPQESLEGAARIRSLTGRSALWRIVLEDLGMARVPTSGPFLTVLGLFFLNLAAVLVRRTGPVLQGLGRRPPAAAQLEGWLTRRDRLGAPLPAEWDARVVAKELKGFGYRPVAVGPEAGWAVKHSSAPLGSLLFHSSFLLLALGGALLYYTRFEGRVRLAEGQVFDGTFQTVVREPLLGPRPAVRFEVRRVEASTLGGEPIELAADLLLGAGPGAQVRATRINHPAGWGAARFLVNEAGPAPVLWLQDRDGFTRDRVAITLPLRADRPMEVGLDGGRWTLSLAAAGDRREFPDRAALARLPFAVTAREGARTLFEGTLGQGGTADLGDAHLLIPEVRYWAGIQVVSERGGGLLMAGFLLAVVGLCWRLLLHRRELVVAWDGGRLRMNGKGEYFGRAFQGEMEAVFRRLLEQEKSSTSNLNGGAD